MSTIQVIAIAAAAIIVVLLVVALLVTRKRGGSQTPAGDSFLGEAPQDTLAGLGVAEPPGDADVMGDGGALGGEQAPELEEDGRAQEEVASTGELYLQEEGTAAAAAALAPAGAAEVEPRDEPEPSSAVETAGSVADQPTDGSPPEDTKLPAARQPSLGKAAEEGRPEEQSADGAAASQPGMEPVIHDASKMVPLSDVIVTTSSKMVDLQDPEVRRMLTDLVRLEVDQAIEYRRQGQTVDAVMQLGEAEKISRALGLTESAERVHRMLEELKRKL